MIQEQVENLHKRFQNRINSVKSNISHPLTPNDEEIEELELEVQAKELKNQSIGFESINEVIEVKSFNSCFRSSSDPLSHWNTLFIMVQCICFGYNAWAIPFRTCFHIYQTKGNNVIWASLDYSADLLYLLDSLFVQTRLQYLDQFGLYSRTIKLTSINYLKSIFFRYDLVSLIPLDLLYFWTGFSGRFTLLRFPRLLRYRYFSLFFQRLDTSTSFPLIARLTRTINIMLFLIHVNTCAYYLYSDAKGIGSNSFVYDGEGFAYIRCFYLALKCSLSIGKNPKPDREDPLELIFMGGSWLVGVFFFAVLIGNVKDIVSQSSRDHDNYMRSFDRISQFMLSLKVEKLTIKRVKEWCNYTWTTQKSFDEKDILGFLPQKLQTDIALDIHFDIVRKVKLFEGCDPRLLRDITQRLKPMIFLPGDYICKEGDVGKEMFIITTGSVQVVGGENNSVVFVTLGQGVCFGEIALLSTGTMNRRTANVRAHGFTTLYTLFKEDLSECLIDYPEDRMLLAKKTAKAAKEVAHRQKDKNEVNKFVVVPLPKLSMVQVVEKAILNMQ
ncbi:cyclic nucleotide-gated channel beta-1-like [Lepeophtheirus salmonis]|uniref:cyclic nucleotide-gated channel beta-1-like n=1 Tax=Lepeophtheirus salmonis TaxID=72036 RepID=UPI001AE93DEF|nr:cyclic nucleotide-gated cation channel beta-1-like [Lepeophtheirus salmonis]